jgi:capsular exopolysaccharide synthesis family protein
MSTAQQFPPNVQPIRETTTQLAALEEDSLDLRRIAATLRRRKIMIGAIAVIGTVVMTLYVGRITPLYKAETQIVIEPERKKIVNIDQVAQNLSSDWLTPQTEAAIIRSRDRALLAVQRLDLVHNPAFNPNLRPPAPGALEVGKAWLSKALGAIGIELKWLKKPAAIQGASRDIRPEDLVDAYLGGLEAIPQERSRLIKIVYTSTDPLIAAAAANAAATIYIESQNEAKTQATREANAWLDRRVNEVREQIVTAQQKRDDFRRKAGIVQIGDLTVNAEQLGQLNSQLLTARTARQQADARYAQILKLQENGAPLESAPDVLSSPLIQNLRLQEIEAARKIAELKTQFRDGHPKMILAKAEMADIHTKLQAEITKIASQLRHEAELTHASETALQSEAKRLQQQVEQQNDAKVTLDGLEADLQTWKQLYETLLSRYKETEVQDSTLQRGDAQVVSPAIPPAGPFYPPKKLLIAVAFLASFIIGIILAIAIELLDFGFRSLTQIEALTGLPTLGMMPLIARKRHSPRPHQIATAKPGSIYGEAVRTVRTALLLSDAERPPRTLLVTSSVPNEGKTATALSIVCQSAQSGQRCIAVDCDLRQSAIHSHLGAPNKLGLSDYLLGKASLEEIIEADTGSKAHFISAGTRVPNPTDLLGSVQMRRLVKALSEAYDFVILDTPPVLAVSDALVMVRYADATLFLIRWEKTRRQAAVSGLKLTLEAGANLAGVVMTQVDVKRHAQYNYADSGYYYGGYAKYYTDR